MARYATNSVFIDHKQYNRGDVLPPLDTIKDRSTALRYSREGGSMPATDKAVAVAEPKKAPIARLRRVRTPRAPGAAKPAK